MKFKNIKRFHGEERIVKRFAWLPKRVDDHTIIWLESYYSHQMYLLSWRYAGWFEQKATLIKTP